MEIFHHENNTNHLIAQLFLRVNGKFSIQNCKRIQLPPFLENEFKLGMELITNEMKWEEFTFTIIDWLRLQDYRTVISDKELLLPGQLYKGLGIGHEIDEMLISFVSYRERDGILNTPEHWYNAYLYYTLCKYHFFNPAFEGYFKSIVKSVENDIHMYSLTKVSWAIAQGKLIHIPSNSSVKWVSSEQFYPMNKKLKKFVNSKEYKEIVERNYHPEHFYINWND